MSSKILATALIYIFIFSTATASYDSQCSSIVPRPLKDTTPLPPDSLQLPYIYGLSKGDDRVLHESKLKLIPYYISETNTASILHVEAYLILLTRSHASTLKRMFQIFGYWSQSDSKLCMVEKESKFQAQSLALLLNLNRNSTITNSLVKGTFISTDSKNNTNHISLLGYNQYSYEYTLITKGENSCSRVNGTKNSASLPSNHLICSTLQTLNRAKFELEYDSKCGLSNCNLFGKDFVDFLPRFMTINVMKCSKESKFQLFITFSNTTFDDAFYSPKYTLISEAFWDVKNNRLCAIGCKIKNSSTLLADSYVHECDIGVSLSVTGTFSIVNRSSVTGKIWSSRNTNDLGYFEPLSFRSLNTFIDIPGLKYEYKTAENICNSTNIDEKAENKYPNPAAYNSDMEFNFQVKYRSNRGAPGYFHPLFISNMQYTDTDKRSRMQKLHLTRKMWNLSYEIGFQIAPDSIWSRMLSYGSGKLRKISADGVYDSDTGLLCMTGCRYIPQNPKNLSENFDRHDCKISIDIQFPPMNPTSSLHSNISFLSGSIRSTRNESDPLYFETLNLVSRVVYARQAEAAVERMVFELAMVLISLTLTCIFVALQIYYLKKHTESLSSVSVLMVVILTLWIMLRLIFGQDERSVLIQRWIEADEAIIRVITIIAFVLLLWLLQMTLFSKFDAGKKFFTAEVKVVKVCFLAYIIGGFIAWFEKKSMKFYLGLVLDGFLMPQIMFNVFSNLERKALAEVIYVGMTLVRIMPRLYDVYRYCLYIPAFLEAYNYFGVDVGSEINLPVWDVLIVCVEIVLAVVIFVQQRRAGAGSGGYKPVEVQMS